MGFCFIATARRRSRSQPSKVNRRARRAEDADDSAPHCQSASGALHHVLRRDRRDRLFGAQREYVAGGGSRLVARLRRGADRSVTERFFAPRVFLSHLWAASWLAVLAAASCLPDFRLPPADYAVGHRFGGLLHFWISRHDAGHAEQSR